MEGGRERFEYGVVLLALGREKEGRREGGREGTYLRKTMSPSPSKLSVFTSRCATK